MKRASREALDAYYREAGSWASDRLAAIRRSERIAWIIALAGVGVAVIEAIALVILLPLKTVEPYTLLVDRNTGYVQALSPLKPTDITPDQALVQSMLVQYVIARETFDVATVRDSYRKVGLWSADPARQRYIDSMRVSSADSPLVLYPPTTVIETRVKSVSPLNADTALIRFDTLRRDQGGLYAPPQPWVATLRYRFSDAPMSTADRFTNPLGFQVTDYRRDPEALPSSGPVEPSASALAPAAAVPQQ